MEKDSTKFIYLHLFGSIQERIQLEEIESQVELDFGRPVRESQSTINPADFFDVRRQQYHSTALLKEMLSILPSNAEKMLGIIEVDLFIPILTFVFGEAQLNGPVGIVSTARLRQEFYGLPPNNGLMHRRLIKEIKHELGHNYGLVHCSSRECVMSAANNISSVDAKGQTFCASCSDFLRAHV